MNRKHRHKLLAQTSQELVILISEDVREVQVSIALCCLNNCRLNVDEVTSV